MAFRDESRFRTTGTLGSIAGGLGGRIPGPLGIGPTILLADVGVTALAKTLTMPTPAKGDTNHVHEFTGSLYNGKVPALADVQQGALAVCPIAAILGALAFTPAGRTRIQGMIGEHSSSVTTDLTNVAKEIGNPPKGNKIVSSLSRYFAVAIGGKYEVSDVLYTDDADRNWTPTYMRSPTGALWPCLIEKAFAVKVGSYEDLDDFTKHTLNMFWKVLVGKDPDDILTVNEKTKLSDISNLAKDAAKVPTVGASRDDATEVLSGHGLTVMGLQGSSVLLQDPNKTKPDKISLEKFRSNFQMIFSGKP